ncbi:hypothetical protein [Chryseobacterium oryzae]|uniref:DUF2892 domain-containing protein n=1 Tax=Chryseobacterium oryzae TaxID=2929799 RepID=A0ABY4BJ92_9FLAO|nr:hypothetical protein [Chryseobacterium oryzae]UOE39165.1 hypothetical protein MTP08_05190 [Chryseobacterium oryzae]
MKANNFNLVNRIQEPTPKWFKIIRSAGLILSAVGGTLVAAPVALPATLVSIGGYLLLGGTLASAISQTAISSEEFGKKSEKNPENPKLDQDSLQDSK